MVCQEGKVLFRPLFFIFSFGAGIWYTIKVMSFGSIKKRVMHHKEHFLTVFFFLGFIVDNITLNRVDSLLDNAILVTYIVLAMLSLLFLYAASAGKFSDTLNQKIRDFSPMVTQNAFGGLFSGMLIFYGRSGSWMVSWPFLLVILAVIYGNETIKDRVQQLLYSLGMLYVGLFAYVVLVVPIVIGQMGAVVFVGSAITSLIIMLFFIRSLAFVVPRFIDLHRRSLLFMIGTIFASYNFLYFENIIPPIPLSLKELGAFHSVVHFGDGSYQLTYEKGKWWQFYKTSDTAFHVVQGDDLFCFARVYAPTTINTKIFHVWQYYDEGQKKWIDHAKIPYPISGGNYAGYRGYTLIQNYRNGSWRCSVQTERGQVLGRVNFTVDSQPESGALTTRRE